MKKSSARIQDIGETVFAEMTSLAVRHEAVNLGQGFPDTDGPDEVIEEAVRALRGGRNQYAPGHGIPELRQAIAEHQRHWYDITLDPDTEIAVTTGATEALAAAAFALIDPGDDVLVLEPWFDSFPAVIQMAGGVRRPVTLRAPDFRLDADELRAAVTPRTKVMLLNSPHNPTGTVLGEEELRAVAEVAVEHDLLVLSDEVYEHLTFDGIVHRPISTFPGMADRTLTISSGGKSFAFTGWKVGWATGPAELIRSLLTAKQFMTFTSGAPLQPAIAVALGSDDAYFHRFAKDLQDRRDQLCEGLDAIGFDVFRPQGTYFVTTDIRPLGYEDGTEFCLALPERARVVGVPMEVFYDDPEAGRSLVRWAFCKREPVIAEALDRLRVLAR